MWTYFYSFCKNRETALSVGFTLYATESERYSFVIDSYIYVNKSDWKCQQIVCFNFEVSTRGDVGLVLLKQSIRCIVDEYFSCETHKFYT